MLGIVALLELLANLTTMPPVAAFPVRVIVPVDVAPPPIVDGFNVMD